MDDLDLAENLRVAIGDFVRRVRRHDSMPPGQAAALGHLDRTGPLSIADLARSEHIRHQAMTRTVNLLHDQDFVTLTPHQQDRRQLVVTITARGRRALNDERRSRAAGMARAIRDNLDDDEREIVRRMPEILNKLQP